MSDLGSRMTALVTGASRGIGRAIARALAARGVRVALHYHTNEEAAKEARAQLAGDGHFLCSADLGDAAATARFWRDVVLALGRVDVLVNNAGIFADHPPLTTDFTAWEAAWRRIIGANLLGPANLSLLAAQAMAAQPESQGPAWGRGRIVNISSRGAFRGEPDTPAYGASKAGLNSLSQSLAKALAARAVYVYCLAPGFVGNDMATRLLEGTTRPDILAQDPFGPGVQALP